MRDSVSRQNRLVWVLLLSMFVFAAGHRAHALGYVVVQPIVVCGSSGPNVSPGCAPFNDQSQSPDPSTATNDTPIGFVDPQTNINLTRAIWLRAGIDVLFFPIAEWDNTAYLNI